jgi:hypothetical protein
MRKPFVLFSLVALLAAASFAAEPDAITKLLEPGATPKPLAPPPPGSVVQKRVPSTASRAATEACTPQQTAQVEAARKTGAVRTQVATDKARGLHPHTGTNDRAETRRLADELIEPDIDYDQIVEITEKIRNWMSRADLPVVCSGASDENCGGRAGYVLGLSQPIHVCPEFFSGGAEERVRTLIHESAHLARIGKQGTESYCGVYDCSIRCGDFSDADGWSHFVHCLSGQPADTP